MIVHISHEFVAMEAATQLWVQTNLWIAVEDALLHIRLAADFLWPANDQFAENAVLAEHYVSGWRGISGGPPVLLRQMRGALNDQLAHITRQRADAPQDLAANTRRLGGGSVGGVGSLPKSARHRS